MNRVYATFDEAVKAWKRHIATTVAAPDHIVECTHYMHSTGDRYEIVAKCNTCHATTRIRDESYGYCWTEYEGWSRSHA